MTKEVPLTSANEAGFRALFEYATVGILVVSASGRIELANPCIEKLFGYKRAEIVGQFVEVLIPEALRGKHVNHRERYFTRPNARPMGYGLNLFARKKDGTEFPVEISLGHYELNGDKLAVAFITDITESKRSQEELEEKVIARTLELTHSLEREKELNEIKSRFVSMASHEFRTPLTTILSSLALVETYTKTEQEEKRKKHIEKIKESARNLTGILDDFLLLDKAEQGKIELRKELFDLYAFAVELVEELNGMLKRGQQIILLYNGEGETMQDKKILRSIFLNLLSNAIKYSPEDKFIDFSIEIKHELVSVKVKDRGIGIPEADQQNLFGKFYRATNATNIQGTGLGLNIVQKYVELLGGIITFTSKPGEGTEFILEFPQNPD